MNFFHVFKNDFISMKAALAHPFTVADLGCGVCVGGRGRVHQNVLIFMQFFRNIAE